jgi:hypothetical protein
MRAWRPDPARSSRPTSLASWPTSLCSRSDVPDRCHGRGSCGDVG